MLLLLMTMNAYSQPGIENHEPALQLNATYKGDFVHNFQGGITTGSTYLGLADLFVSFDTEKAGLWKGGEFLVHGANTHGGAPSAELVGDFQGISNIEAGNHTFLYELWIRQKFFNVTATVGLQDLNVEFANSNVSSLFINSSFGINSVMATTIVAPIFPVTKPGITVSADISDNIILKSAVYKGCPVDFEANPHNLNWDVNYQEGLLFITEGQYTWTGSKERYNIVKGGVFFHQYCPEDGMYNYQSNHLLKDHGVYLVGEHQLSLTEDEGEGLKIFYQGAFSPGNENFGYFGAGFSYTGLLSSKGSDVFGLAFADGMRDDNCGNNEISFELTYKVQLSDQLYLQPDMQYVVRPGGTTSRLENATVGLLRVGMEF
jgi:porin